MSRFLHLAWATLTIALLLTGCFGATLQTETAASSTPTFAATSTQTPLPPTLTLTPTLTPIPSPTSTPEPLGCLKPPEDYTRLEINGWTINQRSYHDNGAASFGTHLGGGAVDLSVLRRGTYTVLWDDVEPVLHALRAAGFAAWLREYGELYADSPIHIHAIAIGDQELSGPAEEQLTGEAGYFHGFSGLPVAMYGPPKPDRYGGPILCQWMIDMGYQDLR